MAHNASKAFELVSEEAAKLVRGCAKPLRARDNVESTTNVKAAIRRAGLRLGFTFSRTRSLWYGEARRIDAGEMDILREQSAQVEREVAINYLSDLRQSLANANQVESSIPFAALDDALRALGAPMRSVDIHQGARDARPPPTKRR